MKTQQAGRIGEYMSFLIFGEPGAGKTVFAGTSPNALILRPPMDGTESLKKFGLKAEEKEITTWEEMWEVPELVRSGKHSYEWVWLDSITLFQEVGLDDIMDTLVRPESEGGGGKLHRNVFQPGVENYGENMNRVSKWVRVMRSLPINFGITAHVMRVEDLDGEARYMPSVQGKNMAEKISGYMGLVASLRVMDVEGDEERVLVMRNDGKWYGKDRYNLTEEGFVVDPKVPELVAAFRAQGGGAKEKPSAKKTTKKATARRKRPATRKSA